MTRPPQPEPYPGDLLVPIEGALRLTRRYHDVLGRPMTGSVTITGTERHDHGDTVIPPASVTVEIKKEHQGLLTVDLPPDTYRIAADLRTRDGVRVKDSETITLE